MEISILKADLEDIYEISLLADKIWKAHYSSILSMQQIEYMLGKMYSHDTINREMKSNINWDLILVNGQRVGFMSHSLDNDTVSYKLSKLYVLPEFHGKGVGQFALSHLISSAKRKKADNTFLFVNKKNEKAIKSYEKAGFVITESVCTDIGSGFVMDDYIMTYFL